MAESAKRHDENSNLIKEIQASMDAAIRNQEASIKALEIQIGHMSKSISTTIEAETSSICRIESTRYAVSSLQNKMQFFEPNQSIIPFPSRLIDDSYEEREVLGGLINRKESATNLKRVLMGRLRMGYQIEASMNVHDSAILDDALPPIEKDPRSFTIPCNINNICFEKALADLGASVSVMPYLTFTNLGLGELAPTKLIIELVDRLIKRPKGIAENILVGIDKFVFPVDFIVLDMPKDIKVPLILKRPFLSTAHAKIDVFERKIALRVEDEKIVFKSDNPTSNIIKKVYVLGLRERMELDLEARIMGEALILNRSLDPVYGDYIDLNDLNEPWELRRNQKVEDLGPTIEEGQVIDELNGDIVKTRDDNVMVEKIDEYPSFCDYDRKIKDNCAYNIQFSCMIGYEHVNANLFPILSINVMSKKIYNSIMKNKIEYKRKNVVGAFINVPIFIGKFSVITDFAVVENIDVYHDKDMGDVIVGKPFCREVCVEARRFDGFITICNGNDIVTYQMARTHPRFKHLSNEECNKIRSLLKDPSTLKMRRRLHGLQVDKRSNTRISQRRRNLPLQKSERSFQNPRGQSPSQTRFLSDSQNRPKPKTVVSTGGSNINVSHEILTEKLEALAKNIDSEFLLIGKELKEMRDGRRDNHNSQIYMSDDTLM
ncbi:uncharacterized mitochondrial protein-like protein [Tanacetum coccineum]